MVKCEVDSALVSGTTDCFVGALINAKMPLHISCTDADVISHDFNYQMT